MQPDRDPLADFPERLRRMALQHPCAGSGDIVAPLHTITRAGITYRLGLETHADALRHFGRPTWLAAVSPFPARVPLSHEVQTLAEIAKWLIGTCGDPNTELGQLEHVSVTIRRPATAEEVARMAPAPIGEKPRKLIIP